MTATATGGVRARAASSAAVLRLAVQGAGQRCDLRVPAGTTARELLASLPDAPGSYRDAPLARAGGLVLEPDADLGAQGVRDGDLLLVLAPLGNEEDAEPEGGRRARRRSGPLERRHSGEWALPGELALLPGALAVAGVAAGFAATGEVWQRLGVAAGLLLAALVVAVAPRRRLLPAGCEALAPAFAGAAVVALLPRAEPGADLLAIVAAGVVAAQAAALTRMVATPAAQAALTVWLWLGGVVAAVAALALATDGSPRVVWAVLAVLALAATRLLPGLVVDVPDEQLIDSEQMSATTWSVRGFAPARRVRIRSGEIADTVLAGRHLLDAGAVLAAAVAAACAVGLALDPIEGWERWLAYAGGGAVGLALLFGSRAYGGGLPRLVLRVGGLIAVCAGAGGAVAAAAGDVARFGIAGGCVLLALAVLPAAVALGRGWRSVWWARFGDMAEGLAVAAAFPVALLAAGAFDHFRQVFS